MDSIEPNSASNTSLSGRLLIALIKVIAAIPYAARIKIGEVLGQLMSYIPTRDREIARQQLRMVLKGEPDLLVPEIYRHFGRLAMQSFNINKIFENPQVKFTVEGEQVLKDALSGRRGVVALTAHLGNWELLAAYVIRQGARVYAVGREANYRPLQEALAYLRESYGLKSIWRSDKKGLKQIIQCLKGGDIIAALIDQDTRVHSELVNFIGVPARTPARLVEVGLKYNAHIVAAFIVESAPNNFRIFLHGIEELSSVKAVLECYSDFLGQLILRYPQQWVWFHKRWRTLPDGKRLSGSEYLNYLRKVNAKGY
ncbi:MAG: hypothetical protein D6719_04835 [Candidatus Dadabacteria bacterium]|nr:MAG: hypothetical protein D6719_04835 [Candidatus Dadabacteria bacterium]